MFILGIVLLLIGVALLVLYYASVIPDNVVRGLGILALVVGLILVLIDVLDNADAEAAVQHVRSSWGHRLRAT
jgi:cadmium resistance protein CadD (predicted permease)